ncbi:MAG: hypothetical protein ACRDTA_13110 [Pseudonocardiaceae bacterium]
MEMKQFAKQVRADVVIRRNSRDGHTAAEHLIGAALPLPIRRTRID